MSEKSNTIQDKMSELSALVAWFQGPEFSLEKAVDMYKQAEKLAEEIEADLSKLKNDITIVKQKFDSKD